MFGLIPISPELKLTWSKLSWADRLLPLLVILSIILGILLSVYVPSSRVAFDKGEVVGVSFPLAIGLIIMMIPPLCRVEWENIVQIFTSRRYRYPLLISLFLNWIFGPFVMLALAWISLFSQKEYREGVIMIGLARCIAMVVIWNDIADGNNDLCAVIVLVNSLLQVVLYAPYQIFMINVISGDSSQLDMNNTYTIVAKSVAFFLGIPLVCGLIIRAVGVWKYKKDYEKIVMPYVEPFSLLGLLYMIIVIFIQQGHQFISHIGSALLCFIPLTLYFFVTWIGAFFFLRYLGIRAAKKKMMCFKKEELKAEFDEKYYDTKEARIEYIRLYGPVYADIIAQVFTAASNNFELTIAVVISVYGVESKQAIASTFGPLLEVPILLFFAFLAKHFQNSFVWADVPDNSSLNTVVEDTESTRSLDESLTASLAARTE